MSYISFQPNDYFNTKLYTGTDSSNAITGVGFQPDWTWIKRRNATASHAIQDAVRGNDKSLRSNTTGAEYTNTFFSSFDTDGFTVTSSESDVNASAGTYASWNWKANGQGSANTDGSTNTTYTSVNTTAGFSISKWTPSGSAETVGHGLGAVPKVIITKNLGASQGWFTYHHSIGNTKYLLLNDTAAEATDSTAWNNTTPTSSVFSVGSQFGGSPYIAYCFAEKKGFSKFGSYTGNGSVTSPPFIYTGFKPAYVLIKAINATEQWGLIDNKRNTFNPVTEVAFPNSSSNGSNSGTDFLANGFAPYTGDGIMNLNSSTNYIYMAFSEESIVSSNGVPATAR
jgi:hypothetical protein